MGNHCLLNWGGENEPHNKKDPLGFKKHEMSDGDNPPIGILLCTEKNHTLVEYAMGESSNELFVSKYKLSLPSKSELKKFVEEEIVLEDE